MREPVRDKGRLEHMKAAIEHVLDFTKEKPMDDLSENSIEYFPLSYRDKLGRMGKEEIITT